jgi:hypothetical protein
MGRSRGPKSEDVWDVGRYVRSLAPLAHDALAISALFFSFVFLVPLQIAECPGKVCVSERAIQQDH